MGRALVSGKEHCPKALTAERSSGNMPGKPAFFRYQRGRIRRGYSRIRRTHGIDAETHLKAYALAKTVKWLLTTFAGLLVALPLPTVAKLCSTDGKQTTAGTNDSASKTRPY